MSAVAPNPVQSLSFPRYVSEPLAKSIEAQMRRVSSLELLDHVREVFAAIITAAAAPGGAALAEVARRDGFCRWHVNRANANLRDGVPLPTLQELDAVYSKHRARITTPPPRPAPFVGPPDPMAELYGYYGGKDNYERGRGLGT